MARSRISLAIGAALVACCLLSGSTPAPRQKTPVKKKAKRRPATPPVSPAARAAAQRKVEDYLAASAESPFQQPASLVPFFEQLVRLAAPSDATGDKFPAHIIQFGDSHTAADEWTGGLRDLFQETFGDGGSGFSLAGRPFLGYRRFDARGGGSSGWVSEGLRAGTGDGWFGLGGVSISTSRAGLTVFLQAECDHIEIQFLQQPGGGRLALYDFDDLLDEIPTDGALAPGFVRYLTQPGPHRFLLKTLDARPVRLFGWVADKTAGVTYEALGINGAEAPLLLKWDETMLSSYLQRRAPALIVLSYGTNEASDPFWQHESYAAAFGKIVMRLRQAVPAATILVLGPADRWIRVRGKWQLVAGIDNIISQQQTTCRALGCVYWDTRARIGGPGSIRDWQSAGLAQGDRVHFTAPGYRRLATVLYGDLMRLFDAYKKARPEASDSTIDHPGLDFPR